MKQCEIINNVIYSTRVGSTAYGTAIESSDVDEGGIAIPNKSVLFGQARFDQWDRWVDSDGNKVDKVVYNLQKAVKLMYNNNPNMLDYLYMPDKSVIFMTPEWERIADIRDKFLCIRSKESYAGYARGQLTRIKIHRSYLQAPVQKPSRSDFELPDVSIFPPAQRDVIAKISTDFIETERQSAFNNEMNYLMETEALGIFKKYMSDDLVQVLIPELKKRQHAYLHTLASVSSKYLREEYVSMAGRELAYMAAVANHKRYVLWKKQRNPQRQLLEAKCGYDSKHAMHLIRLAKMSVEILDGRGVCVDRSGIDASELIDIRRGNWNFEDVTSLYNKLSSDADKLVVTSSLPPVADKEIIVNTVNDVIEKYLFGIGK